MTDSNGSASLQVYYFRKEALPFSLMAFRAIHDLIEDSECVSRHGCLVLL